MEDIFIGQDGADAIIGLYSDADAQEYHSIRLMNFAATDLDISHNFIF